MSTTGTNASAGILDGDDRVAVRLRDVSRAFSAGGTLTRALAGIDLDLRSGEVTLIVGPSGCGKTTLLSVLCGTLSVDAGSVSVLGVDLVAALPSERSTFRARRIGFVFQQFNLIPVLSAAQNVSIPLRILRKSRAEAERESLRALDRVGLADRAKSLPSQLSGGQQQRVAIARALVHAPDLVVCDEPTSALDSITGRRVMELIAASARERGRMVVVVTHDPRIFTFADRLVFMEDGRIASVISNRDAIAEAGTGVAGAHR